MSINKAPFHSPSPSSVSWADGSTAASSLLSYLRRFRPPQGNWRADDGRKSAETKGPVGGRGCSELEEGVSQVSRWLPPAELLHADRKVTGTRVVNVWMRQPASGSDLFIFHRLLILTVNMWMYWTARGITLHRIISVTSGSLSCSQAPIKVGVLLYYGARNCF